MALSELRLRTKASFSRAELEDACALVQEAGWNQLPADWRVFLGQGRVWAIETETGRIVATTAILPFGGKLPTSAFAWISMVLVAGSYRRRGLATLLMREAMDHLAARDLIPVLDATPDGREIYRRLGFQDCWGFQRLIRRERAVPAAPIAEPPRVSMRSLTGADWPRLAAYDAAAFGADRAAVLAGLRGRLPATELVALQNGRIVGFLLGRDGRVAAQLGPLVAENDAIARALAARAIDGIDGPLIVDLADVKTALRTFLEERGFTLVRPFTRMFYGRAERFDDERRTFAVVGPEFG